MFGRCRCPTWLNPFLRLCEKGSVFPSAFRGSFPCALFAAILRLGIQQRQLSLLETEGSVLKDSAAWSGFTFVLGFLLVFRTSQAYTAFWEGSACTHRMRAEWFDGCSSLIAFCRHSRADPVDISRFKNILVRLFSMLHAAALADIEDCASEDLTDYQAFNFALLDVDGIDETSLSAVKVCSHKVEMIYQWIQEAIINHMSTGVVSIPSPLISRSFQQIANGMVAFHHAMTISYTPFPFAYSQMCDMLLFLQWIILPFVVSQWVEGPVWAAVFTFSQVFFASAINLISIQLENPFGSDVTDLDLRFMQEEFNEHLMLLVCPSTRITPQLSVKCTDITSVQFWLNQDLRNLTRDTCKKTFVDVWKDIAGHDTLAVSRRSHNTQAPARRSHNTQAPSRRSSYFIESPAGAFSPRISRRRSCTSESQEASGKRSGMVGHQMACELDFPEAPQELALPALLVDTNCTGITGRRKVQKAAHVIAELPRLPDQSEVQENPRLVTACKACSHAAGDERTVGVLL